MGTRGEGVSCVSLVAITTLFSLKKHFTFWRSWSQHLSCDLEFGFIEVISAGLWVLRICLKRAFRLWNDWSPHSSHFNRVFEADEEESFLRLELDWRSKDSSKSATICTFKLVVFCSKEVPVVSSPRSIWVRWKASGWSENSTTSASSKILCHGTVIHVLLHITTDLARMRVASFLPAKSEFAC